MSESEARTTTTLPGVVLPPPETLRDYASNLLRWANGEEVESFLSGIARRLSFGETEKAELREGAPALLDLPSEADLVSRVNSLPVPARGALALALVVRGVHQLLYHQPKRGNVPPDVEMNLAWLESLELALDEGASAETSGFAFLARYRHSLARRGLARPAKKPTPSGRSLVATQEKAQSDAPEASSEAPKDEAPKEAPKTEVPKQSPAPPTPKARRQAPKAAADEPPQARKPLLIALAVVALVGVGWFALRPSDDPDVSAPASISELPVQTMTRYPDAVAVRVDPAWLNTPPEQRRAAAQSLLERFQRESGGAVQTLRVQDADGRDVLVLP